MEVAGTPDNNKQTDRNLYFDAAVNRRGCARNGNHKTKETQLIVIVLKGGFLNPLRVVEFSYAIRWFIWCECKILLNLRVEGLKHFPLRCFFKTAFIRLGTMKHHKWIG